MAYRAWGAYGINVRGFVYFHVLATKYTPKATHIYTFTCLFNIVCIRFALSTATERKTGAKMFRDFTGGNVGPMSPGSFNIRYLYCFIRTQKTTGCTMIIWCGKYVHIRCWMSGIADMYYIYTVYNTYIMHAYVEWNGSLLFPFCLILAYVFESRFS